MASTVCMSLSLPSSLLSLTAPPSADRQVDYPRYLPGLGATIGAQGLILVILVGLTVHFKSANAQVEAGTRVLEGRQGFKYSL